MNEYRQNFSRVSRGPQNPTEVLKEIGEINEFLILKFHLIRHEILKSHKNEQFTKSVVKVYVGVGCKSPM